MLWVFISLLGGFAFVFLTKLYWSDQSNKPDSQNQQLPAGIYRRPLVTLAIVALVVTLIVMISTGRLNWLSAAVAGIVPFLRRFASLLRYAPMLANLMGKTPRRPAPPAAPTNQLSPAQARAILEVSEDATKDEIVTAHRALMAKNHPDRGGSNYIAAQLNSAKELLLEALE